MNDDASRCEIEKDIGEKKTVEVPVIKNWFNRYAFVKSVKPASSVSLAIWPSLWASNSSIHRGVAGDCQRTTLSLAQISVNWCYMLCYVFIIRNARRIQLYLFYQYMGHSFLRHPNIVENCMLHTYQMMSYTISSLL